MHGNCWRLNWNREKKEIERKTRRPHAHRFHGAIIFLRTHQLPLWLAKEAGIKKYVNYVNEWFIANGGTEEIFSSRARRCRSVLSFHPSCSARFLSSFFTRLSAILRSKKTNTWARAHKGKCALIIAEFSESDNENSANREFVQDSRKEAYIRLTTTHGYREEGYLSN